MSEKETWKNTSIGFVGQGRKVVNNQNDYWSAKYFEIEFQNWF